jgi:hypothetical protein
MGCWARKDSVFRRGAGARVGIGRIERGLGRLNNGILAGLQNLSCRMKWRHGGRGKSRNPSLACAPGSSAPPFRACWFAMRPLGQLAAVIDTPLQQEAGLPR